MNAEELARYDRHLRLPEVGLAGQTRLKAAKIAIVGLGGLGSPAALYLAAAGVGRLGLMDFDQVDASNLQRQIVHSTDSVGLAKVESAARRLKELNPLVELDLMPVALRADNALELLRPYDLILDGSDNFSTRFLVNDACAKLAKPFLSASIYRFEGQLSLFHPSRGSGCYRCLYPEPPPAGLAPSCAEAGVLGVLPGVLGTLQASEALKFIVGMGKTLEGQLLLFDALNVEFRTLKLRPKPDCRACQGQLDLVDLPEACAILPEISAEQLWQRWQEGWRPTVIDVREAYEWDILNLSELGACRMDALELDQLEVCPEVVVYCKSGARSRQAQEKLLSLGFSNVLNLSGGILAFQSAIRPDWPRY